jgi:hypothetical protein
MCRQIPSGSIFLDFKGGKFLLSNIGTPVMKGNLGCYLDSGGRSDVYQIAA